MVYRRESTAGTAAEPGSCMPSASATMAIVDAVPIVMQCPLLRDMHDSARTHSSAVIRPARTSSANCHTAVPEPMSRPGYLPVSIGPPLIMIVGRSTLAAPISEAGVVLSHPDSRTTPSTGLARIDSSTSMLMRLRNNMVVGRISVSPSDITGNSSGNPPASHTPRLTDSATRRRCTLQGVGSDQLLQIPMTGRPSNTSFGKPCAFIHERWMNPFLPGSPNHSALRKRGLSSWFMHTSSHHANLSLIHISEPTRLGMNSYAV